MRVVGLMVMCLGLGVGCAVGQTISYHEVTPALRARADRPLALIVQDQRAEVVSNRKAPEFVGILRAGFGNPWDVTTTSEKSFADDVMGGVARGLTARGYKVTRVPVDPSMTYAQILEAVAETGRSRALFVQVTGWKSDTYMGTKIYYDVTARVIGVREGVVLGAARIVGADDLGAAFFNPKALAQREVPLAYRAKMEALLNAPQIVAALTPPVAAPEAPPAPGPVQPPEGAEPPASAPEPAPGSN